MAAFNRPLDQYRRDIHKRGRQVSFRRIASALAVAGEPEHGNDGLAAPITLIAKFKALDKIDLARDGVLESDQGCQFYPPDVFNSPPVPGDQILDGDATLIVMAVRVKRFGETHLRYDLRLRG